MKQYDECKGCIHDINLTENRCHCFTCECFKTGDGPYLCYCINYHYGFTNDEKCKYKRTKEEA